MSACRAVAVVAMLSALVGPASAEWPERPVRIIYPYAAGSTGDVTARLIAQRMSRIFGQPFIVENRLGANGVIATEMVARSTPDGYTLLWAITPQIAIAPVMTKVRYDPAADLIPISAVSTNRFALVVNSKLPARTVPEFVDYVRAQHNEFTYAEGGAGSIGHLAMVLFLDRAGLSGTNVSYKGNVLALTDVMAGHLPAMFALFGDALAQAQGGAVRLLAITSNERSSLAPDVPTIAESGFSGFGVTSWWGLMAPAGTPKRVVDLLAREVSDAVREPKIVDRLNALGVDPLGNTPTDFAAMIFADIKLWAKAVRLAGLRVD